MPNSACSSARHGAAPVLAHIGDDQHVGAVGIELEPVGDVLAQHRRRERPKALAILDLQIEVASAWWASADRRGSSARRASAGRTPCGPGTSRRPAGRPAPARSSRSSRLRSSTVKRAPAAVSRAFDIGLSEARAEERARTCRRAPSVLRGWPLKRWTAASAAPTAPPASPAAG